MESLDREESSREDSQDEEDKKNLFKQGTIWQEIHPEVKSALQKKIKFLSLEFLRMKSLKVSRCKSKEETEQLMKDFINFRSKLEDAKNYIDNL